MGNLFQMIINGITRIFQGIQGSYAFALLGKAFLRLRTAVMNPFQRVVRRVQQLFNANIITSKLVAPINAKVRKVLNGEAKSPEDYFTIGRFWISKMLVYILVLAGCAAVFIYFNWVAAPLSDTTASENVTTTVYYDYDDVKLGEYSGKANIRAANGNVVYTGDIAAGVCKGNGTLWKQDGTLLYEGGFENNRFSGNGILYYANGSVRYQGAFKENEFSGSGVLYYEDKTTEYIGNFENGAFQGEGALYNENGILIYEGEFQSGTYHGQGSAYYDNGVKKYEGGFYMGKAQGKGTSYDASGRKIFEGQFVRDGIQYESLLGQTLDKILAMMGEKPVVYFNEGNTSFLFERAQVILKADCLIEMQLDAGSGVEGDSWYIPNDNGQTLDETEASQLTETTDTEDSTGETADTGKTAAEKAAEEEQARLDSLPVLNGYHIYYYLSSDKWQAAADLDTSAVYITAVTAYGQELNVDFLDKLQKTPENGAVSLQECAAIERVRMYQPTAFSSVSYELTTKNKTYIQVGSVNMAEAIYEEVCEENNVRYRLCYEMDEPDRLMFLTVENN